MKRTLSVLLITFLSTAPALADDNAKPPAPADLDDDDTPPPPDQPDSPAPRDPAPPTPRRGGPGPDVRGPMRPQMGKPRLGVAVTALDPEQRTQMGVPAGRGTIVDNVQPGSVAERAGLRAGDVIIDVDGEATRDGNDIVRALADRRSGDVVAITIIRGGKSMLLRATLANNPDRFDTRRGGRRDFGRRDPFENFDRSFDAPENARLRRELDEARRRIDELERRIEKLERPRT